MPPSSNAASSNSACAMPCASPPWICPSTISGLTTAPTSSTHTYLRIWTRPVSVSTSTAHRCVPCGNEKFSGSKVASESSDGSIPSGRSCAANTASAMSWMPVERPVPFTLNVPAENSRSSSEHSIM